MVRSSARLRPPSSGPPGGTRSHRASPPRRTPCGPRRASHGASRRRPSEAAGARPAEPRRSASCLKPWPGPLRPGRGFAPAPRLVLGPDHMEGVVLQGPHADAVARRLGAVLAGGAVVTAAAASANRRRSNWRSTTRRDPPARDGVEAQLEKPGGHQRNTADATIGKSINGQPFLFAKV